MLYIYIFLIVCQEKKQNQQSTVLSARPDKSDISHSSVPRGSTVVQTRQWATLLHFLSLQWARALTVFAINPLDSVLCCRTKSTAENSPTPGPHSPRPLVSLWWTACKGQSHRAGCGDPDVGVLWIFCLLCSALAAADCSKFFSSLLSGETLDSRHRLTVSII